MTDTEKRILAEKMFSFENYLIADVNYYAIIDNMITFEQECRKGEMKTNQSFWFNKFNDIYPDTKERI